MTGLRKRLTMIFQNRVLQHILFWCASYYYLVYLFSRPESVGKLDLIYAAVFQLPFMLGVYVNLFVLIPKLLSKGRFDIYIFCFAVLAALTAYCNGLLFDDGIDYLLPNYYFISDYDYTELLQFSLAYMALTTLLSLSRAWFNVLETKKERINAELLFLKMQINPHFLFNSLNNIYSLTLKKDDKAPLLLLKLSDALRYMVYESSEPFVLLSSELSYINDYVELHRLRTRDQNDLRFEVSGEAGDRVIAPLILIVFIENAFKHGVMVDIDLHLGNQVTLKVENTKGIVDEVEDGRFKGLGLENVRRRLELIYAGNYVLEIKETDDAYAVLLKINVAGS